VVRQSKRKAKWDERGFSPPKTGEREKKQGRVAVRVEKRGPSKKLGARAGSKGGKKR